MFKANDSESDQSSSDYNEDAENYEDECMMMEVALECCDN